MAGFDPRELWNEPSFRRPDWYDQFTTIGPNEPSIRNKTPEDWAQEQKYTASQEGLEDTSDVLLNLTDPMQARQIATWGLKGAASTLPFLIGAFETRPWLRKPLADLVGRKMGPEVGQRFLGDITTADPKDSYQTLINALQLQGKPGLQGTHGLEWEAVSDTPPQWILPYHGRNIEPYFEEYSPRPPFRFHSSTGTITPQALEDIAPIHGDKINAMVETGLRGTSTHPYPMELVSGVYHGEEGVEQFKNEMGKLAEVHPNPRDPDVLQPRIVGGETAGGHANLGHPQVSPETIPAFTRTWLEDISPWFYPTQPQNIIKSREDNAYPLISNLRSAALREWQDAKRPRWLGGESLYDASTGPGKFNEVNYSKLGLGKPYIEIRSPRSPKDVGEAVENMTVTEAAMQEALRRQGTPEGQFPESMSDYLSWLYENKIKPNADEIRAFRSGPGLDPNRDPIVETVLNPNTYDVPKEPFRPYTEPPRVNRRPTSEPFNADNPTVEQWNDLASDAPRRPLPPELGPPDYNDLDFLDEEISLPAHFRSYPQPAEPRPVNTSANRYHALTSDPHFQPLLDEMRRNRDTVDAQTRSYWRNNFPENQELYNRIRSIMDSIEPLPVEDRYLTYEMYRNPELVDRAEQLFNPNAGVTTDRVIGDLGLNAPLPERSPDVAPWDRYSRAYRRLLELGQERMYPPTEWRNPGTDVSHWMTGQWLDDLEERQPNIARALNNIELRGEPLNYTAPWER